MRARSTIPAELARGLPTRLDDAEAPLPSYRDLRPAAVIALLLRDTADDHDPRLLLIERSATLRAHAGQVAFPGGKPEPHDDSLIATALREANEEVALPTEGTRVVGRLRPVPTPTFFMVVPFVGWAPLGWEPAIASPEVHCLITPRMSTLADPAHHNVAGHRSWRGFRYALHEFTVHTPPVWGATAHMVWDLLQRLELADDSAAASFTAPQESS